MGDLYTITQYNIIDRDLIVLDLVLDLHRRVCIFLFVVGGWFVCLFNVLVVFRSMSSSSYVVVVVVMCTDVACRRLVAKGDATSATAF